MTPAQEKKLDTLLDNMDKLLTALTQKPPSVGVRREPDWGEEVVDAPGTKTGGAVTHLDHDPDTEALYQSFKARLLAEAPALIRVLVSRPEIEVAVTREVIKVTATAREVALPG